MSHSQQKGPSQGNTIFFLLISFQSVSGTPYWRGGVDHSVCVLVGLSVSRSVTLYVCWSGCLLVCLSVCLSVCRSSFKNKGVNISLVFEKVVVVYLTLYFYPGVIQSTPLLVEKFWLKFRKHQNVWQLSWRQNTPIVRYAEQIMCQPL